MRRIERLGHWDLERYLTDYPPRLLFSVAITIYTQVDVFEVGPVGLREMLAPGISDLVVSYITII